MPSPALFLGAALLLSRPPQDVVPDDARVTAAWTSLSDEEQADVAAWFTAEAELLPGARSDFLRYALSLLPADPGLLPEAPPPRWFDPKVHAPAEPIPRRLLDPQDPAARALRERLGRDRPARRLKPAWRYDWGTGEVQRSGDPDDPQTIFENALAGFPPRIDLAEAAVLSVLDDGSERSALFAFGHLYTDRKGRAYPLVTLYDAWSSGQEIEMPDVDTLGIVHTVLDEWRQWKAPIRGASKQRKLYETLGDVFTAASRHRGLREALARTYLSGTPVLEGGYDGALLALHDLWEEAGGDPAELAKDLPRPERWKSFLAKAQKAAGKKKRRAAAEERRAALDAGAAATRALLVRILTEYGALDRVPGPAGQGD